MLIDKFASCLEDSHEGISVPAHAEPLHQFVQIRVHQKNVDKLWACKCSKPVQGMYLSWAALQLQTECLLNAERLEL